jgi:hypothetical protein
VIAKDALGLPSFNERLDEIDDSGAIGATVSEVAYENETTAFRVGAVVPKAQVGKQFLEGLDLAVGIGDDIDRAGKQGTDKGWGHRRVPLSGRGLRGVSVIERHQWASYEVPLLAKHNESMNVDSSRQMPFQPVPNFQADVSQPFHVSRHRLDDERILGAKMGLKVRADLLSRPIRRDEPEAGECLDAVLE